MNVTIFGIQGAFEMSRLLIQKAMAGHFWSFLPLLIRTNKFFWPLLRTHFLATSIVAGLHSLDMKYRKLLFLIFGWSSVQTFEWAYIGNSKKRKADIFFISPSLSIPLNVVTNPIVKPTIYPQSYITSAHAASGTESHPSLRARSGEYKPWGSQPGDPTPQSSYRVCISTYLGQIFDSKGWSHISHIFYSWLYLGKRWSGGCVHAEH